MVALTGVEPASRRFSVVQYSGIASKRGMMLHKLRRAMINLTRDPLRGEGDVDDTWVGGANAGSRGANSKYTKEQRATLLCCYFFSKALTRDCRSETQKKQRLLRRAKSARRGASRRSTRNHFARE